MKRLSREGLSEALDKMNVSSAARTAVITEVHRARAAEALPTGAGAKLLKKVHPAPWSVLEVPAKGRRGLYLDLIDARGGSVLSGFGYFYRDTLEGIASLVNLTVKR